MLTAIPSRTPKTIRPTLFITRITYSLLNIGVHHATPTMVVWRHERMSVACSTRGGRRIENETRVAVWKAGIALYPSLLLLQVRRVRTSEPLPGPWQRRRE